jgi:HlyD family secretion protein
MPVTTIYLDALEGGRVEQKFVEDGAMVKKGQPLLRLSNTDLALSLINQETSVYNLLTQMQISRNVAVQNTVNKLNQLADVGSQLKEAKRIFDVDKQVYQEKAIGLQEFEQAENNYLYYNEKMKLSKQILEQDSFFNQQQLQQSRQSYEGSQNALNVMRKKVGDLFVRAPIDGQLTALDVEIGQKKRQGERIGQVDAVNGFKVRPDVDEHYISRVYNGLKTICTVAGKDYTLNITKVFAQVVSGKFQVDMQFKDLIPDGIKRGQTLQIQLILGDSVPSVLLPKGSFSQQTGGNWVYVLNKNGNQA